jgi:hypothetical protein
MFCLSTDLLKQSFNLTYSRARSKVGDIYQMRSFYAAYQDIFQTLSGKSDGVDPSSGLRL